MTIWYGTVARELPAALCFLMLGFFLFERSIGGAKKVSLVQWYCNRRGVVRKQNDCVARYCFPHLLNSDAIPSPRRFTIFPKRIWFACPWIICSCYPGISALSNPTDFLRNQLTLWLWRLILAFAYSIDDHRLESQGHKSDPGAGDLTLHSSNHLCSNVALLILQQSEERCAFWRFFLQERF
jgi:hypothetical protein